MKNTLERLRQLKTRAVDRMEALNALAKKETRELTPDEKLEYEAKKTEAEEFTADIAALEAEMAKEKTTERLSALPANTEELKRQGAEEERLRVQAITAAAKPFAKRIGE